MQSCARWLQDKGSDDCKAMSFLLRLTKRRQKVIEVPLHVAIRNCLEKCVIEKDCLMATPNVDKMSLKDLLELEAKVQKAISAARDRERAEVKHALAQLAEKRGFSVSELFGGRGRGKSSAAKYVNPDNKSETWTGRGRKPNWLVAKLGKGAKITDFAI
jgi:DNA-binding protein H-NS